MDGFLSWLGQTLYSAVSFVFGLLDICPFGDIIATVQGNLAASKGFAWLNWLVPVGGILGLLATWLVCLGVYYGIQILLRWVRAIR